MSFCTKGEDHRQHLIGVIDEDDTYQPSLFVDLPQNQTVLATGQSFAPAGGDLPMPAIAPTIGHNSGPAMGAGYDFEPVSRRWIAVATDMRFHHLVGCGQSVPPADPSRGAWSRYEAWQDLICEAAWKQRSIINKGRTILLDRGQLMAARSWLAQRWNWTEKTVRTWISKLENETMIEIERGQQEGQQKQNLSNVVTICNYDIYQTARELQNLLKGQQGATEGPARGQQGATEGPELIQGIPRVQEEVFIGASAPKNARLTIEMNCTAVRGPGFEVPYDAIDVAGGAAGLDPESSRKLAAEIAKGIVFASPSHATQPEPAKKAKVKNPRPDYTPEFEEFWAVYRKHADGMEGSKGQAFPEFSALAPEDRKLATVSIPAHAAKLRRTETKFKHACRFLKHREFDGYAPETSQAAASDNRELQIKALALDLEAKEWNFSAKFWKSKNDVPSDIVIAAKRRNIELAEAKTQHGW